MMAIAHTLVAGAVAAKVGSPILAPALSLATHFLLDSIPHWDFGTDWKTRSKYVTGALAITDTLIGIALTWIIFSPKADAMILALCIAMSLIPDWLEAPLYLFFITTKRTHPKKNAGLWERFFHGVYTATNLFHTKTTFFWGMLTQILSVSLILWVLQ